MRQLGLRGLRFGSGFIVLLGSLAFSSAVSNAITIRHDVPEADYISLSTDPKWSAGGVFTPNSTCSTSGGTLIHPEWVITAAHCSNGTADFILGADRSNPDVQVSLDSNNRNPGFTGPASVTNGKDLALLHLTTPILSVTPARLFRQSSEVGRTTTVIGYGQFGTGLTGDNQGGTGIRRAGQNRVDVLGQMFGWSPQIMVTDFDNPSNTGDNATGPAIALPFESGIGFFDSGSGWFVDFNGITYLSGVTSFRANGDGTDNSDYGDIFGGTRVSQELSWIDANHDVTQFWNRSTGDWNQDANWLPGAQPGLNNAAVIDGGVVTISDDDELAEYTYVVGNGQLTLSNDLTTSQLLLREGGRLEVSNATGATMLNSNLRQGADGTLAVNVRTGPTVGIGHDRLVVSGDAEIDGTFEVIGATGSDPAARGTIEDFVLLVSDSLTGSFDEILYDGDQLAAGTRTYTGINNNGDDGMFRTVSYDGNDVVLENYLALTGDANGDGSVDGADFLIWNAHKFTSGNDWTDGDFNGNGTVDGADFLLWNDLKFTSVDSVNLSAVPEPTSGAFLVMSCLILAWIRKR